MALYNGSYDGYCEVNNTPPDTRAEAEKAVSSLETTIISDPDALHSRCLQAGFLLMLDRDEEAAKRLDEVRAKQNDYYWRYIWEAASHCKTNDVGGAINLINQAFSKSPTRDVEQTVWKWNIFAPIRNSTEINWPSKKKAAEIRPVP